MNKELMGALDELEREKKISQFETDSSSFKIGRRKISARKLCWMPLSSP